MSSIPYPSSNNRLPTDNIAEYKNKHKGERKLILKKKEINKLIGRINQEGLTLVPTKLYFSKGKVKVQIAVAKGKKLYDKRQVKKTRDWRRQKAKLLRNKSRIPSLFVNFQRDSKRDSKKDNSSKSIASYETKKINALSVKSGGSSDGSADSSSSVSYMDSKQM